MRIRVLQVIASSEAGGAEHVFQLLLDGLDRARFDVCAAYPTDGGLAEAFAERAPALAPPDLSRPWRVGSVLALARQMRRSGCDIVHSHLWSADVIVGAAASLAGIPVRIATVHGNYFERVDETGAAALRKRLLSRVFRAPYGLFDHVIAVSDAVRRDLVARPGIGIAPAKIRVIPNGLDVRGFASAAPDPSLRERLGLPARGPLVSTVANFVAIKGHRWLVAAIPAIRAEVPDATFVLYGSGPGEEAVRRMVAGAGVDASVVWLDTRAASAWDVLALSDVVVVPSVSEGFGLVALEALAAGKPVVATAVGGITEIVEDGRTGILVPPRDPVALAKAVVSVLRDPGLAAALGAAGRASARAGFPVERMVRAVEDLYVEAMSGKGLGRN